MLPELFRIGDFPIRSYGVLFLIGVLVAVAMAAKRAPRYGLKADLVWDSLFWMLVPGVLGARITYIAQNWSHYSNNTAELFSLQFNGLTSFGGLIFGFVGLVVWLKIKKAPFWSFVDVIGVPVLVAHSIGRIGCLLNGCCYGYPCTDSFCVHVEGQTGTFLPAQAFDAGMSLAMAGGLILIERGRLKDGASFSLFLAAYGASRFIYEFWRAGPFDPASGRYLPDLLAGTPITKGQAMALVFVLLGAALLAFRQAKGTPPAGLSPAGASQA